MLYISKMFKRAKTFRNVSSNRHIALKSAEIANTYSRCDDESTARNRALHKYSNRNARHYTYDELMQYCREHDLRVSCNVAKVIVDCAKQ